ncbi:non-hydrolyzing UDP-N-acetylglucosamine 2-epimerase [Acaryochloris sp. IP29b_bin.148]|uniref:non-hydrolyzing UDP-N-acetylglucosamine 2-epimerase n=1 Tax=Acaryochloris sp. IP29b_bin.148 TaxID=2969218 RepID=UPI002612EB18|nr:UDP-N-acetylglucosamine 2-epimerase (non-hydrolyzing) [Acaryochloris sp. IP29b_bin.148]
MKCLTIIGARPQFIKASAVSRVLSGIDYREIFLHTGQHYDQGMSEIFFTELEIKKPDDNLGIGSGTHGQQTGKMIDGIEEMLIKEQPNIFVVYGDTNSTLASAIAAAKLHIPIAHIEAGLRSLNRQMPEEINRVLTDHASDILLIPTKLASANLIGEGINQTQIFEVGDVMYNVALAFAQKADQKSTILNDLKLQSNEFILATIHRAENADDSKRLEYIFNALCKISEKTEIILPLHPRRKKALQSCGLLK